MEKTSGERLFGIKGIVVDGILLLHENVQPNRGGNVKDLKVCCRWITSPISELKKCIVHIYIYARMYVGGGIVTLLALISRQSYPA